MLGKDVVNTFQGVPWLTTLSWYLVSNIHSAKGEELGSRLRVLGGLLEMSSSSENLQVTQGQIREAQELWDPRSYRV